MANELRKRVTESLPELDAGAGFTTKTERNSYSDGGVKYGVFVETIRVLALLVYLLLVCTAIHTTQWIGIPLYFINKGYYYSYMAMTKQFFGLVTNVVTQWYNPTLIRISSDASVRGQLKLTEDGRLETSFPERMVLITNHQLYSEWLYLWWVAYSSRMHGHIFIILKESLKYIPFFGPGMLFYGFIFLARNWLKDKPRLQHRLRKLKLGTGGPMSNPSSKLDPMWLLIFPEGTNLSGNTRKKSVAFAQKEGLEDMKYQLLPRSTGLQFCLQELEGTVEWLYDCTIAYEGIPPGQYGQDIYTLRSTYFQGRVPPSVNMYWRRFAVSSIPVSDSKAFEQWVRDRWIEKDRLLEQFQTTGRFPADEADDYVARGALKTVEGLPPVVGTKAKEGKLGPGGYRYLETDVRNKYPGEWLLVFVPSLVYAALAWGAYQAWRAVVG